MPRVTLIRRGTPGLASATDAIHRYSVRGSRIMVKLYSARVGLIFGITLLGACTALLASCVWLTRGETHENRYTNYTEARESQQRGWLPTMLPASATEIHEWHNIDTNVCIGSFRFDPAQRSAIEVLLRPGLRRAIQIDRDPSFASPLPRDPSEAQLRGAGFEFYTAQDFDFAISWKAGMAYFWTP